MGENQVTTHSRRTVLAGITVLVGAVSGLAASDSVAGRGPVGWETDTVHEGYTRDTAPEEGGTITVEPRCGETCEVIRATGLSPECSGGEAELYVDLHGTEPTVWINPKDSRNADVRPGTYRVVNVESCERNESDSESETLYRVRFRAVERASAER